ncbi:MAG: hypothetical protein RL272_956 [Candidatus Parcubacteria bacterium]
MRPLGEKPTLADHQAFIAALVAEKGWTADPDKIFVLLSEEVGELAKELRRSWKRGMDGVRPEAASELADVFMYLVDLANAFGVDLEQAVREKIAYNDARKEFGH